ncbi:hypothetical protein RND61_14910 [Streptomyces sp. TRM76323]|uniref:Uncharacterized protein n=1 Tax=Streptomyces tamarix TaxID=3078565 RepID=A0ABU3QKQ8_9ACTN|nr:hypothetical protein [Streptomyces tamarix]MDT9683354.1 hypothetical protein [Streptomyces tamarix]
MANNNRIEVYNEEKQKDKSREELSHLIGKEIRIEGRLVELKMSYQSTGKSNDVFNTGRMVIKDVTSPNFDGNIEHLVIPTPKVGKSQRSAILSALKFGKRYSFVGTVYHYQRKARNLKFKDSKLHMSSEANSLKNIRFAKDSYQELSGFTDEADKKLRKIIQATAHIINRNSHKESVNVSLASTDIDTLFKNYFYTEDYYKLTHSEQNSSEHGYKEGLAYKIQDVILDKLYADNSLMSWSEFKVIVGKDKILVTAVK